MNKRNVVIFLAVLIITTIIITTLNVIFVFPKFMVKTPGIQSNLTEDKSANQFTNDFTQVTLSKIYETNSEKYQDKTIIAGKKFRNPFQWQDKHLDAIQIDIEQKEKEIKEEQENSFKKQIEKLGTVELKMVLINESHKMALINNELVSEGSRFRDHTIDLIESDGITLNGEFGKKRLLLSKFVPKAPEKPKPKVDASEKKQKGLPEKDNLPDFLSPLIVPETDGKENLPSKTQMIDDLKKLLIEGR